MLEEALVVLLDVRVHLHRVDRRATTFLLDVRRETQGLRTATRVLPLVRTVLELRLLRVVPTVEELTANEL